VSTEQNRLEDIISKLRQRDFRITPQRIAILKAFLQSSDHPGIDQVYEKVKINFPTTSLATVYKTVKLLKDEGEILEINFGDGANRYDGNKPYPHPHLVCTRCKKITDPAVSLLDKMTAELASSSGYHIESHQVEFFGVCPECQKK
jgi:Fur family peroxide stress response transcriptional regulator